MKRCENMASQTVPTRYDYKVVELRCGSTGISGDPIYCEECSERIARRGHMPYECRHGVDMRDEGAFCVRCEFGEGDE